jgi:cell division protein FtsI/penicillin-binding protein 2
MRKPRPSGLKRIKSDSRQTLDRLDRSGFQTRLRFWVLLLLVIFGFISLKLVKLQLFNHAYYLKRAQASHVRQRIMLGARGTILDRNGKTLASSLTRQSVFIDPTLYPENLPAAKAGDPKLTPVKGDNAKAVSALADLLKIPATSIEEKLAQPGRFFWLKRSLSEEEAQPIIDLKAQRKLRWIGLQREDKRFYPHEEMAAQTLGFVGEEGSGLAGIEAAYNKVLGGRPGRISMEVDARGRPIPGLRSVNAPTPGRDITLTLDSDLQQIAEAELAKGIKSAQAAAGSAIIMDPRNGEILALASQPAFDPNGVKKADASRLVNPVVVRAYEPGSTFKLIVACACLEEGWKTSDLHVHCTGALPIGRRTIHDAHGSGHGDLDLGGIIEESCNIGAASLGLRLGRENLAHYVNLLGFGQKTGIELFGESPGQVPPVKQWSDIRTANIAFGQGLSVTPLQLLRAYCVVGNGGYLVRPHLMLDKTAAPPPKVRVLSETTAEQMRRLLIRVVETGTGKTAAITGYVVGGKTGTAQKAIPGVGYRSGKYIGSFIGLVPADNPRLAILVLMDEPKSGYYGGVVAAPVFREIARQALLHLALPPQQAKIALAKSRS